jgi:hypothetical protein
MCILISRKRRTYLLLRNINMNMKHKFIIKQVSKLKINFAGSVCTQRLLHGHEAF